MTLGRVADQLIGAELQMPLVKNGPFNDATYQVGRVGGANDGQFGLVVAAAGPPNILTAPGKFLQLTVDITAITATGTVTVSILGVDGISGKTYLILASAALGAVATTILRVGPGLTAAANLVANDFVPVAFAIQVVVAVAQPMTFSLGALFMP